MAEKIFVYTSIPLTPVGFIFGMLHALGIPGPVGTGIWVAFSVVVVLLWVGFIPFLVQIVRDPN